jgi:hypothetical protein
VRISHRQSLKYLELIRQIHSGISVQNPDRNPNVPGGDIVRDLLRRAAEGGPPPAAVDPAQGSGERRWGAGNTLGSDEVESTFIPDPNAPAAAAAANGKCARRRDLT